MPPTSVSMPLAADARIDALDVVRGVALLGIGLMNIEALAGPLNEAVTGLDPTLRGADRVVDAAIAVLVQGKFYALFSLVFGMGVALMAQRAGAAFAPVQRRRLLGLLVIGALHLALVWSGDILTTYALVGLVLLAVAPRIGVRALPWVGVAVYLLPSLVMGALGLMGSLAAQSPEGARALAELMAPAGTEWAAQTAQQRAAYGSGSFAEATAQRLRDGGAMLGYLLLYGPQVLGLFLLGGWLVRSGAITHPDAHARLFTRLRTVALPVGLAMVVARFWLVPTIEVTRLDLTAATANALGMVGALLMALGYLAWILRGLQAAGTGAALRTLAPAGRMALTNYLAQSLVCTWVFYGYGLGAFDVLPRAWQPVVVLALFALQVAWSTWWLRRYAFGPVEWLWRGLTYGHLPPLRA